MIEKKIFPGSAIHRTQQRKYLPRGACHQVMFAENHRGIGRQSRPRLKIAQAVPGPRRQASLQQNRLPTATHKGWLRGLEPPTFGTTIRRSNQLSYSHREYVSHRRHIIAPVTREIYRSARKWSTAASGHPRFGRNQAAATAKRSRNAVKHFCSRIRQNSGTEDRTTEVWRLRLRLSMPKKRDFKCVTALAVAAAVPFRAVVSGRPVAEMGKLGRKRVNSLIPWTILPPSLPPAESNEIT